MSDCDHSKTRKYKGKNWRMTNYEADFDTVTVRCKACGKVMGCIGAWRDYDDWKE